MNHTEYTMPRSGRTVDRMTVDAGWAGWHYRGHRWWRPLSYLLCFGTFALIGALMAWRG